MSFNMYTDKLTGAGNLMKFLTDDYDSVFGDRGQILFIKLKPIRQLNEIYSRQAVDEMLMAIMRELVQFEGADVYRILGGEFVAVFKDNSHDYVSQLNKKFQEVMKYYFTSHNYSEAYFLHLQMDYHEPLRSIADFYGLFYDTLMKEEELENGKEVLKYVLENLAMMIKRTVWEWTDVHDFALHDDVSGLPNSKSAKLFIQDTEKPTEKYTVFFIDGDSLSLFNEVSYDEGNKVIHEIASVLTKSIRKGDKLFRWLSGDEFIVIATGITKGQAVHLAERMRKSVEAHCMNMLYPATISIGVASMSEKDDDLDKVISRAEKANKEAKRRGRNQFVFYENIDLTI